MHHMFGWVSSGTTCKIAPDRPSQYKAQPSWCFFQLNLLVSYMRGLVSSLERVLFNYERYTWAALATSCDGNEAGLFEHTQSSGLRVGVNTQFPHHQVGNGEAIGAS